MLTRVLDLYSLWTGDKKHLIRCCCIMLQILIQFFAQIAALVASTVSSFKFTPCCFLSKHRPTPRSSQKADTHSNMTDVEQTWLWQTGLWLCKKGEVQVVKIKTASYFVRNLKGAPFESFAS